VCAQQAGAAQSEASPSHCEGGGGASGVTPIVYAACIVERYTKMGSCEKRVRASYALGSQMNLGCWDRTMQA
jgi:hypothetical protein